MIHWSDLYILLDVCPTNAVHLTLYRKIRLYGPLRGPRMLIIYCSGKVITCMLCSSWRLKGIVLFRISFLTIMKALCAGPVHNHELLLVLCMLIIFHTGCVLLSCGIWLHKSVNAGDKHHLPSLITRLLRINYLHSGKAVLCLQQQSIHQGLQNADILVEKCCLAGCCTRVCPKWIKSRSPSAYS